MQTSSHNPSALAANRADDFHGSSRAADRVYQCMTVAAMLFLLASLWAF
ncbi:MAG TPA: hypothetical protein VGG26_08725 [Terracidiphilus sp.]|jgi:hypothetical protein